MPGPELDWVGPSRVCSLVEPFSAALSWSFEVELVLHAKMAAKQANITPKLATFGRFTCELLLRLSITNSFRHIADREILEQSAIPPAWLRLHQ